MEDPFKVWFLKLYLGHILRSSVSQWRMSISLGLREADRLLLGNIAIQQSIKKQEEKKYCGWVINHSVKLPRRIIKVN